MQIQRAYHYELVPDGATRQAFARCAGARRFVWNKTLAVQSERHALGENHLSDFDMTYLLELRCEPQAPATSFGREGEA